MGKQVEMERTFLREGLIMKNQRFSKLLGFILLFGWGEVCLHSVPILDDWKDYQSKVLEEHPQFNGWCPPDKAQHLMELLLANPSDVCVEVGVFGGSSLFPIASALAYKKKGLVYAVDPWTNDACVEGYNIGMKDDDNHIKYWGTVDLNKVMFKFIEGMHKNGLDPFYLIMRMSSEQAYVFFEDESVDFIHIDGNHSEQAALFDVEHWLPKIKKGGIICFDDAWWKSTQPAIKVMLKECEIMNESSPSWQYIFLRKK